MLGMENSDSYDATALVELIASGDISAHELLDMSLSIAKHRNPALNALVNVNADLAHQRIEEGLPDGPLKGVPFLLKDLGTEAVDWPSHNGSRLLFNTHYAQNSTLVDRLNTSGLAIFGRTTSPEGGIGSATESRVYGGPTRNPWDTALTPGGSSGGAGAAVAAGILPAAYGSDGDGSVRIPASSCGLVGFKPTRARRPEGPSSGEGWAGMAIDGFLTRSVRDTAQLLDEDYLDYRLGPDRSWPGWCFSLLPVYSHFQCIRSARCVTTAGVDKQWTAHWRSPGLRSL